MIGGGLHATWLACWKMKSRVSAAGMDTPFAGGRGVEGGREA